MGNEGVARPDKEGWRSLNRLAREQHLSLDFILLIIYGGVQENTQEE